MNLYNILNSIDNTLERENEKYCDSFVDNFIDELKDFIAKSESLNKLDTLPSDTLFSLDRYEGDFAVCENRTTGEMFDIPRSMVTPYAKDGDILKRDGSMFKLYN